MDAIHNATGCVNAGRDKGAPVHAAPSGRQLIDVRAFAAKLHCDTRTVYRLADAGAAPWGIKVSSLRRWDEAEVDAWIAGGCQKVRTVKGGA